VIILDTNVLSELTKPRPDERVTTWLDTRPAGEVATTAVTIGELLHGVARLPAGRRRDALAAAVGKLTDVVLAGRVMPFDAAAAAHYGLLMALRAAAGRPIGTADGQIAAICRNHRVTLATRNTKDFDGTGVVLINPWLEW
jgi:predicted nucleic acid-binding protein